MSTITTKIWVERHQQNNTRDCPCRLRRHKSKWLQWGHSYPVSIILCCSWVQCVQADIKRGESTTSSKHKKSFVFVAVMRTWQTLQIVRLSIARSEFIPWYKRGLQELALIRTRRNSRSRLIVNTKRKCRKTKNMMNKIRYWARRATGRAKECIIYHVRVRFGR